MDNLLVLDDIAKALNLLKKEFKNDDGFANTWHNNIVWSILKSSENFNIEPELARTIANESASTFMKLAFDVVTKNQNER